ncbi:MAG: DUF4157 domain-containing protein [Gaiellales bacterium]
MTTIHARQTPAVAAMPAAAPIAAQTSFRDHAEQLRATLFPPNGVGVSATAQATNDPLQPTATDRWSPDAINPVHSKLTGGFVGAALRAAFGGVDETPGQRLSVAQVDALAPFFATQFGLDEGFVRAELAKVYVYIGGPTADNQAMTVGHHIYVPDEASLEHIMSRGGRRWLTHELAHTMQFLAYQDGNPERFLADYVKGMVVARDPQQPGSGTGPPVWGAFFTGLNTAGRTEDEIGAGAVTTRDRLFASVIPAAAVSVPAALVAGGALKATRATTGISVLGTKSPFAGTLGTIAAPALAGALIGTQGEKLGDGWTKTLGAATGGALAGATLMTTGAFKVGAEASKFARGSTIGAAAALTLAGAAIGLATATASNNTIQGWSSNAEVLQSLQSHSPNQKLDPLLLKEAVHDSHWIEIDAETVARRFIRDAWDKPASSAGPVEGRVPSTPDTLAKRINSDVANRLDWGLSMPLIIGVPAAIGLGASVAAARTGSTVLRTTLKDGHGPIRAIRDAVHMLSSQSRGLGNSLGIGAAVTAAPAIAGGLLSPIAYQLTGSDMAARIAGASGGAVLAGGMLSMLLSGRGSSMLATSLKVGAGAAVAGAVGLLAGGIATEALKPHTRTYDAP